MRFVYSSVGLVVLLPASFAWAQGSLCDPCVDPPAYGSPVQEVLGPQELDPRLRIWLAMLTTRQRNKG